MISNLTLQAPLLLLHLRGERPDLRAQRLHLVVEERRPLGAGLARRLGVRQPVRCHAQLRVEDGYILHCPIEYHKIKLEEGETKSFKRL